MSTCNSSKRISRSSSLWIAWIVLWNSVVLNGFTRTFPCFVISSFFTATVSLTDISFPLAERKVFGRFARGRERFWRKP